MYQLSIRNKKISANKIHLIFASIILMGYIVSHFLLVQLWVRDNHLMHTAIEIFNLSLMLFTFVHAWNTYSETSRFIQSIGFAALTIISINLLHIVNFADTINIPDEIASSLMNISLKYGTLISYCEAVVWLLLGFHWKGCRINRLLGVLLSFSFTGIFYFLMVSIVNSTPLFYESMRTTIEKQYADIGLIFVASIIIAVYISKYRKSTDDRDKSMCKCIIIATLFFAPARICFVFSKDVLSPMHFLGHIYKSAYYYSIYYGMYKATIEYPYMQVRKMKDFYEKLLDTSPVGIITFDREGKVNYASRKCDGLFGYDMRKIYGFTIEQLLNSVILYDSDKSDLLEGLLKQQVETITFYGLPCFAHENVNKLIFSATKLEMGMTFVVRDAKKAQAIQNMQLQTQTLLDATDNVVLLMDINKRIVMCNKKFLEISDTKSKDAVGLELFELSQLLKSNLKSDCPIHSKGEGMMHGNIWIIHTLKGEVKKISLDSSPIFDVDNEKIGWIIIGRDVSEHEKEQEKIIRSEKMAIIGQMAAGLVHEIKNPLSSIKGLCQLMRSRAKPEKTEEYAAVMERAVDDIGEIVNGFLQFSKPTTEDYTEAGINSLVNSLEMMISTNAYKRGVKTHFYYSSEEEPVLVSSHHIKNAILGMVDNALDAMYGAIDPKLIISTEHSKLNNTMSISIKDNGIGMTEEQLASIGTPFYTTKAKGTGLGVSVSKYLVNEHGGTLKIESKFGEGAEFTIILPCISTL